MHTGPLMLLALVLAPAGAKVPSKMPTDPVKGRMLFEDMCWQCHGTEGRGDGPLAAAFPDATLDLRGRAEALWPSLVGIIQDGQGDMPAFAEVMDRHDSRRILVWLAALDEDKRDKDVEPTRSDRPPEPVQPDQPDDDSGGPGDDPDDDAPDDDAGDEEPGDDEGGG